jgi:hypothetical protein
MKNNKNNSFKDGFHLNSSFWQNYKKTIGNLPSRLFDIAIGCILGDASLYRVSKDSKIKFEQGYIHKEYLFHLFDLFKSFSFHDEPYTRYEINGPRKGLIKSYSFRTFSHPAFNSIWDLFYSEGRKNIKPGLIRDHLTPEGLAYWIMDDGSLQNDNKTMIIHTQSYTCEEVETLSSELNNKFKLSSKVIPHKKKYWVILIPSQNAEELSNLIKPYIHNSMSYKIPKIK